METYRPEGYQPQQPYHTAPGSGPMATGRPRPPGAPGMPGMPGMPSAQANGLDWLLDDLVQRVGHIQKAVILSQDGIALGASRGLDQADAEHLAALAAGFQSLARGAGRHFGGGAVRQTIIEMESGFLFVTAAGQGTCLAVLTEAAADVGLVAYEMAVLVQRTSEHLQAGLRGVPAATFDM